MFVKVSLITGAESRALLTATQTRYRQENFKRSAMAKKAHLRGASRSTVLYDARFNREGNN